MESFSDLIRELALIDIQLGGRSFSWSNKRDLPAFAKLDRFLVSESWEDILPLSTCKPLPNTLSDHVPISLHTSLTGQGGNRFHFETMWLEHEDLCDIVARAWSSTSHANVVICLALKLQMTRRALTLWNRTQFGNVKRQKLRLLETLNKLDITLESRPLSSDEPSLQVSSFDDLEKIQHLEETM